jgi:hypothetical protein
MHTGVCIAGVTLRKGRDRPDGGMHPGTCITRAPRDNGMMGGNASRSMHDVGGVYRGTWECMPEGAC